MTATASPGSPATGRRFWTVADQGLSALSNFVLLAVVARLNTVDDFGTFALVYAIYTLSVQLWQSAFGEPYLVAWRALDPEGHRVIDVAHTAWLSAMAPALALTICLGFAGGAPLHLALMLGSAPALIAQDTIRLVLIARDQPRAAFAIDLSWLLLLLASMALMPERGIVQLTLAWAVSGAVSGAAGYWLLRRRTPHRHPLWSAPRRWTADWSQLARPYLAETALLAGSANGLLFLSGAVGGLPVVAAIRGAQTIYGPLGVVLNVGRIAGLAELNRATPGSPELARSAVKLGALLGTLATLAVIAVTLVPGTWGAAVFGEIWEPARVLLPIMGISRVCVGVTIGLFAGVRVLRRPRITAVVRGALAIASLTLGLLGCLTHGAIGAAVGLAAADIVSLLSMWFLLKRLNHPTAQGGPLCVSAS